MENFTFSPSFYRILCIGPKASKQEIKKAYYGLLKVYHPDKNPDAPEWAKEQTQILTFVYSILSDDIKRANYDKLLNEYEKREELKRTEELKKKAQQKTANQSGPKFTSRPSTKVTKNAPTNAGAGILLGLGALALLIIALSSKSK